LASPIRYHTVQFSRGGGVVPLMKFDCPRADWARTINRNAPSRESITMIKRAFPICLWAGLVLISTGSLPGKAAQIAASIEYDFVARPTGLSPDFDQSDGTSPRFLAIKAIDGFQIDAALWQPNAKQAAETTLIVMVHGSGGSYRQAPQSGLGPRLAAKGYASLAVNTRQHDDKINTDNFLDVRRDIEAAVQVGRALGYKTLVLLGHSLGNIQVQFYAATNWDRDTKAVVLLGAFANLPWKSRNILVQDEGRYQQLAEASVKSLRDGTQDQVLPVKMRFSTPVSSAAAEAPITGQHFLTYRWEKTSIADGTFWIRRIPNPILMIRDQSDAAIAPFEPHMLLSAAHSEGSLPLKVDFILLPDAKPPSLKGHSFDGNEQPLTDAITKWLADLHL
jgi:pimeloyl-ACP methyl ester carboxylesterase